MMSEEVDGEGAARSPDGGELVLLPAIITIVAWGCASALLFFPSLLTTCEMPSLSAPGGTTQTVCNLTEPISTHAELIFACACYSCPPASRHICIFYRSLPGLLAQPYAN